VAMRHRKVDYRKVIGFLLITGGGLVTSWLGLNLYQGMATQNWPTTQGMIYSAKLGYTTSHPFDKDAAFYHTIVSYRYQVDGATYTGDTVYLKDIPFLSLDEAEQRLVMFSPASLHTIAYDPDAPATAVLVSGVAPTLWQLLAPAILFLGIGISLSGLLSQSRQRSRRSIDD